MSATEASGNGPDTAERAPLDARGWVPSVFRARPAKDKGGRAVDDDAHNERWADPERVAENSMPEEARRGRERACARASIRTDLSAAAPNRRSRQLAAVRH